MYKYIEELNKQMQEDLVKIQKWFPEAEIYANMISFNGWNIVRYTTGGVDNDLPTVYEEKDFTKEDVFEEIGSNLKELKIKEPKIKEPKIKRTPISWMPQNNEKYYIIYNNGIEKNSWSGNLNEKVERNLMFEFFKYEEEAKKKLEINKKIYKINKKINELNCGWEPDFTDLSEKKFVLGYNFPTNTVVKLTRSLYYTPIKFNYIKGMYCAEDLIKEFEEDLKEIFIWEARI